MHVFRAGEHHSRMVFLIASSALQFGIWGVRIASRFLGEMAMHFNLGMQHILYHVHRRLHLLPEAQPQPHHGVEYSKKYAMSSIF